MLPSAIVDLHQSRTRDIFNALTSERDTFTETRADDDRSRIDQSRIEKQNAHHSFSSVKASRSVGRPNESHEGLYLSLRLRDRVVGDTLTHNTGTQSTTTAIHSGISAQATNTSARFHLDMMRERTRRVLHFARLVCAILSPDITCAGGPGEPKYPTG